MPTASIGDYVGVPSDALANFHGNQLVYLCWDKHLMYAAPFAFPVPPDMKVRTLLEENVNGIIKDHPDTPHIQWDKVTWVKEGKPCAIDIDKSFADNGLKHKDFLRFTTPGLNGVKGLGI